MNRRDFLKSTGLLGLAKLFKLGLPEETLVVEDPEVITFLEESLDYEDPMSSWSSLSPVLWVGDWSHSLSDFSFTANREHFVYIQYK